MPKDENSRMSSSMIEEEEEEEDYKPIARYRLAKEFYPPSGRTKPLWTTIGGDVDMDIFYSVSITSDGGDGVLLQAVSISIGRTCETTACL